MYDYNDEPYYEPTVADEIFFEAREKLTKSLKDTVKQYVENFVKENQELKNENEKLLKKVKDIEYRERELERAKQNLEKDIKKERLSSILEQLKVERFMAKSITMYSKKCDKCNDERIIEYLSPLGMKQKERCDCHNNSVKAYFPTSQLCTEFKIDSQNNNKLRMWYKQNIYEKEEYYTSSNYYKQSYAGEDYSTLDVYEIFFDTLDDCQKYCGWLNRDVDLNEYSEVK